MVLVVEVDKLMLAQEPTSEVILENLLDAWSIECD